MLRDARLHRSPNAGWPESAMAGLTGLALAGPRIYKGDIANEPMLNASGRRDGETVGYHGGDRDCFCDVLDCDRACGGLLPGSFF